MSAPARTVVEYGYGGNERLVMNMGPQHPSAHGVFRMILTLEGETIVDVDPVIGYLHRCHEKLGETLTYVQYPSIASKTDYVAAMTVELAYVAAVELVGKIDVPTGARLLYGFHQPGGTRYDLPADWAPQCRETLKVIEQRIGEYEAMLEDNAF